MYSEEIRNSVLNDFIKGKSIKEISEERNISVPTLYNWVKLCGYHTDTRTSFHEIMRLLQEKDYEMVIEKCDNHSLKETELAMLIKKEALVALKHEKKNAFIWVDLTEIKDLFKRKKYSELLDKYQLEKYNTNYSVQLFLIDSLIELSRLEEALTICNRSYFAGSNFLQSKKITLCKLLAEKYPEKEHLYLEKGLEVCNREEFLDDLVIQNQKITLLMLLAKAFPDKAVSYLREGFAICQKKKLCNRPDTQSQKIKLYILSAEMFPKKAVIYLKKGLTLCNQEEFLDDLIIQGQKITIYMQLAQVSPRNAKFYLRKGLELSKKKCFWRNPKIQSKKIKLYILLAEMYSDNAILYLERGLAVSEQESFRRNSSIQSQKISVLMLMAKASPENAKLYLQQCFDVTEKDWFRGNPEIQSQKITLYIFLAEKYPDKAELYLQKSLEITEEECFYRNSTIQNQKITVLMLMAKLFPNKAKLYFREGLAVCEKEYLYKVPEIQNKKAKLYSLLSKANYIEDNPRADDRSNYNHHNVELSKMFNKICAGIATFEMIESLKLSEFEITVLMFMYYEKNNDNVKALCFVKEKLENNAFSEEQCQILKDSLERLKSKKAVFDLDIYGKILGTSFDLKLYNQFIKSGENEKLNGEVTKSINLSESNVSIDDGIKPIEGIFSQAEKTTPLAPKIKVKTKKVKKIKRAKKETIKEKFAIEYNEILRYLYIKVHSEEDQINAIKAFDRFLLLGERAYDDIYRIDPKTGETIKCGEVFDRVMDACYIMNNDKRVRTNWK